MGPVAGAEFGLAYGMLLLITAAIVTFYVLPNLSSLLFSSVPGLATLIWVIAPGAFGFARVQRSEVRSG